MVTRQGCPQTPGGRIRALGFARMGTRGDAAQPESRQRVIVMGCRSLC